MHRKKHEPETEIIEIFEQDPELVRLLKIAIHELRTISRELKPKSSKPTTAFVANVFSGDIQMADNILVMNVGQTSIDTITPRMADGVSPSNGVLSNVVVTYNDPSATAVLQPDNTVLFTGVAATTAPVNGSIACTVTDTDGAVSTWTIPFTVTISGGIVQPGQLTQSVANVFSTPLP